MGRKENTVKRPAAPCPHDIRLIQPVTNGREEPMHWRLSCRSHWGGIAIRPFGDKFPTLHSVKLAWFKGQLRVCYCDDIRRIPHWLWEREYVVKKPQRKSAAQSLKDIMKGAAEKGGILADCPTMVEWLASAEWEDKTPRTTSTLLIFIEEGRWKGCFTDRDAEKCIWATSESLGGLLALFEGDLVDGTGEWREKKSWNGKSGKK